MVVNVENEVNKHKNCKDRDELTRLIKDYKNLAIQHAKNIVLAGQYNLVALKLQEHLDKLPAPNLKPIIGSSTNNVPVKTVNITREEEARINAAWKQRAKR